MDYIDDKFINLISSRLEKFSKKNSNLYNFRCPICGDSKKNKNKARGFIYTIKNNANYKCHNCGVSISFSNFLKQCDTSLYKEYCLEKFKGGKTGKNFTTPEPKFEFKKPCFNKKLDLPLAETNDNAKLYLEKRKLNPKKFFYTDKFKKFCNRIKPNTFEHLNNDHERIIIPLYNENNTLIGFQGRTLDPFIKPKYLTLMLREDYPKIYGLNEVDKTKSVYVTEGPFDSTFIRNSVAMCGADANVRACGINNPIWIYDNEPRNREIIDRINKAIESGERVVIWPSDINQKDINDMILSGLNIESMIKSNTYSGLEAKVKFNSWKKI